MDLMKAFTDKYTKEEPPVVQVGDTVRVHLKVKEGNRERIQVFEGTVIAKKHGGIEETFTVRRISYGVGVEKVFPLHAPSIEKVEVVRHGKVRRAKDQGGPLIQSKKGAVADRSFFRIKTDWPPKPAEGRRAHV